MATASGRFLCCTPNPSYLGERDDAPPAADRPLRGRMLLPASGIPRLLRRPSRAAPSVHRYRARERELTPACRLLLWFASTKDFRRGPERSIYAKPIAGTDGDLRRPGDHRDACFAAADFPTASRAAISAGARAIAAFRPTSNARRRLPAVTLPAPQIPILMPRRSCSPIAAACPEGGSDAYSGFQPLSRLAPNSGRAGAGPNLRSRLSGLPACVRPWHYYECSYTSLPQCNASASGRSAQCMSILYRNDESPMRRQRARH